MAGWLLFGASCILCINGKGRAGRWVPEWYLDSEGKRADKALVGMWWLAVMVLWPVILPALLVGKLVKKVRKVVRKMSRGKAEDGVSEKRGWTRRGKVKPGLEPEMEYV